MTREELEKVQGILVRTNSYLNRLPWSRTMEITIQENYEAIALLQVGIDRPEPTSPQIVQGKKLWITPISNKGSDLFVEGCVILDREMQEWAQTRNMHVLYVSDSWYVMIGKTFCTPGYPTPEKAIEACWEAGEHDS